MPHNLDLTRAAEIGRMITDMLADEGYSTVEIIPGLIQGVIIAAGVEDSLLDEAANLLADGGVQEA